MKKQFKFLSDAQLKSQIERCEFCVNKPCKTACPANCSPADFIMAAKQGYTPDFKRAAAEILRYNPFGGTCGAICPVNYCMAACVHKQFDFPIDIPKIQATIIHKANAQKFEFEPAPQNNKKIAIIGAGPAGLSAATVLAQLGYKVDIYEKTNKLGGACNRIPAHRLPPEILNNDIQFILSFENIQVKYNEEITDPEILLKEDYQAILIATGTKSNIKQIANKAIFFAGDYLNGRTKVVDAVASGKNAALQIDAFLALKEKPEIKNNIESKVMIGGYDRLPVQLSTDFWGKEIHSPFILSASPMTDGFKQMQAAYKAGWPGAIMKTAFDDVPIHIPGEYMHTFSQNTYGNCDNVSGHPLDRVCAEIEKLIKLYPDKLTIGSTGGSVTGNDELDKASWQNNTQKLENAGAMAVEYSLSCPQGGDGAEGRIVSQNAKLAAKIIDWVMEISEANIPKIFKLTGAVTAIATIVNAVKEVFDSYPRKKAGITLANSFPTMFFKTQNENNWEKGRIVGMSGAGILPISYLTLASVSHIGITVSGNGGPMDYKAAADFLALGAKTVQFCTIVMKYGYEIYDELTSGLSHLMEARNIKSVEELIGIALPNPIIDFNDISAQKKVPKCNEVLCLHCGNCQRCPYHAISLDKEQVPIINASKCIGCSICVQKCFSGALFMVGRN